MPNTYNFSDVFISYSRRDKAFVQKIADNLIASGFELWVDWQDIPPTVDWWQEIQAGIESSNIFVFIISPHSVQSDICRQEIDHAVANHKRIVPILYESLTDEKLTQHLHPTISSHNWVIFDELLDFETWVSRLLTVFKADIDYIRHHTRYLVRAREWDARGKDESFLLRGTDADEAAIWMMVAQDKKPPLLPIQKAYIETSVTTAREEAEIRHRQEALQTLELHTFPAFFCTTGAIAFYIWMTYAARFNVAGWRVAIGIGILFGICMAASTLFSHEMMRIRYPHNQRARFLISSVHAFLLCSAAWSVIQLVYFRAIDLPVIWLGGFGLALGFVLSATFELKSWQGFFIAFIGTYVPIYFLSQIGDGAWTNTHIPLIYFQVAHQRFTLGIPLALSIAFGRYTFPLWNDLYKLISNNQKTRVEGIVE